LTRIPLCKPALGADEEQALREVLASGHLVQGPRAAALEAELSRRLLGQEVAVVSSGTAALHLALLAADVGPGCEVVVPGLTFPAPAHVVELLGARAVPVDIEPRAWSIDPEALSAALGPSTRAVIVVHPFGMPADMAAIRKILATRPDVALIEDAACALGAFTADGPCGALADFGCFSFHPRKIMTTGEGGAVVGRDSARMHRVRVLRNHGQDPEAAPDDRFPVPGYNLRLSDLHAALGLVQVGRLDELIAARRALAERYRDRLAGTDVAIPAGLFDAGAVAQSLVVLLPDGADRSAVLAGLLADEIEATVASYAIHRLAWFRGRYGLPADALPRASAVHDRGVTLPLYPGMDPSAVDRVATALTRLVTHGGARW
jgi:dTDP-4-amino-4,6-dideoxygalactose transaminase